MKIYEPSSGTRMRVVVFVSGGGGNLGAALRVQDAFPEFLEVALVVSDRPGIRALEIARERAIPAFEGHFEDECGRWSDVAGNARAIRDYQKKAAAFHTNVLKRIVHLERQTGILDLAVLSYRRIITGPLFERFRNRMINQHAGDLCALDGDGRRLLIGVNPVWEALRMGHRRTRTSTILVTEGVDEGPILCQGPWVRFSGVATKDAAYSHELAQKELSDWPSLEFALREIARGHYAVSSLKYADGTPRLAHRGRLLRRCGVQVRAPRSAKQSSSDHRVRVA